MPIKSEHVAVRANHYILSRVQSINLDTSDLAEEITELGSDTPVDYIALPTSRNIEITSNFYSSLRNLRALIGATGDDIILMEDLFTATNLTVQIEKNGVLEHSIIFPDAMINELSYNFTVDGFASEKFVLSAYEYYIFSGEKRDAVLVKGHIPTLDENTGVHSVYLPLVNCNDYTGLYQFINGTLATGELTLTNQSDVFTLPENGTADGVQVEFIDTNFETVMDRYATLLYRTTPGNSFKRELDSSPLGGISRGHISITICDTGDDFSDGKPLLRAQSLDLTVNLDPIPVEEQGAYAPSYYWIDVRSVTARATIRQDDLSSFDYLISGFDDNELDISKFHNFIKKAKIRIEFFDKRDTDTARTKHGEVMISGLMLDSFSKNPSVGEDMHLDLQLIGNYITFSGEGILGTGEDFNPDH